MHVKAIIGALVASAATLGVGCAGGDEAQVIPPVVLGMLETTAPTYDDGQVRIFEVYVPVDLPLYRPRGDGQGAVQPYPRAPFHLAKDTRITARFTLSNLEDRPRTVQLLVDPWNEFVRYVPGTTVVEEDTVPNFSGIQRSFVLPPLGRIEGIITPDDMVELATDLATAMQLAATPPDAEGDFAGATLYNRAFNIENRSSQHDPLLASYIPGAIAGVTGFDLGLRAMDEPGRVAVEVILDVEDVHGDRVIAAGENARRVGRPDATLSPPAMAP